MAQLSHIIVSSLPRGATSVAQLLPWTIGGWLQESTLGDAQASLPLSFLFLQSCTQVALA